VFYFILFYFIARARTLYPPAAAVSSRVLDFIHGGAKNRRCIWVNYWMTRL